jgi:hypothetical protein
VESGRPLLTLYGMPGCHLCENMRGAVEELRIEFNFDLQELDVDADPEVEMRFSEHIPVLTDGDEEICRHFFDAAAVRAHLLKICADRGREVGVFARDWTADKEKETPG